MRAVIGGTVVGVEGWSYDSKTEPGKKVEMLSVFLAGKNKYNDKVTVPAELGEPQVGDEVFYVADVSVNRREFNGKTYADLSVWCRSLAVDPFANLTPGEVAELAAARKKRSA